MKDKESKKRIEMRFFRNWWESLEDINDNDTKAILYNAIFRYSFDGVEPDMSQFDAMAKMYWKFIFPLLQTSRETYIDRSQSPGAPKGNKNARKNPKLGAGEWIDGQGVRRYGSGLVVPMSAPARPDESSYWSAETQRWVTGV